MIISACDGDFGSPLHVFTAGKATGKQTISNDFKVNNLSDNIASFFEIFFAKDSVLFFTVVALFSFNMMEFDIDTGFKFCIEEQGAAYTRTSSYLSWIQRYIGSDYCV